MCSNLRRIRSLSIPPAPDKSCQNLVNDVRSGNCMSDNNNFIREDPWRIFRIMAEFVDSFQTLSQVGPAVTIFGSARTKPTDEYYRATQDLAKKLAKHDLAVITGGGPGIME